MSTVAATNLKNAASASNNLVLDSSGNATFAGTAAMASSFLRNRIINGDMRIDQRNAGASVTPSNGQYVIDRWKVNISQSSKFSTKQNAGGATPPPGFTDYLGITSLSAYAVTGNDAFSVEQIIEGFNVSDLNWGTANALPATLSFWVRSSLTGTFGGSIATTRTAIWVMPFSFTISVANTWTYVTVPITAPTSTGGANTDSSAGVFVRFGLGGTGTSVGGTVGVWTNAGNFVQPAGTVSVVGTNGATFYLTGVQLEVGSAATPFERRLFGQELFLCQRYYQVYTQPPLRGVMGGGAAAQRCAMVLPVVMRAAPTASVGSLPVYDGSGTGTVTSVQFAYLNSNTVEFDFNTTNFSAQFRPAIIYQSGSAAMTLSAEL